MEYRYFFKSLFLVLLLALSIWSPLLYFNVVVDPYGVFLKSDIHFPGTANRRHIKINYLLNRKDQYDSFIFGSSRVNCFDPEKFRDGNFYNMTYNAGVVNEHLEDINYLIKKGVKIKKLIIAIDYLSLLEPYSNPYQYLARKKYPETFIEKIDFYKSYLLNKPDMDFVKNTLGNSFSPWRIYMNKGIMESDADMLLNANIENHQLKPAFLTPSGHYLFNYDYTNNIRIIADLVETAKKNNIELIIFVNPIHYVTFLNTDLDHYFEALEELVKVTDYYDFSCINPITINNYFYYEPSHYTSYTADLIIKRLYNNCDSLPVNSFGAFVTKNNIAAHIENHRRNMSSFFDATNLRHAYLAPVNLSDLQKGGFEDRLEIKAINNMQISDDTIFSVSPIINVMGFSAADFDLKNAYLQVGDKYFKIEKTNFIPDYCHNIKMYTRNNWVCNIPARQIGDGYNLMRVIVVEGDKYNTTRQHVIKVSGPKNSFIDLDSLSILNKSASIEFDYLTTYFDSTSRKFLYFSGWASDEQLLTSTGGIIASVGNTAFESQLVFERVDLENKFGSVNLKNAGWGIVIPSDILTKGKNEIVFTALHPNRKAMFDTKKVLVVQNLSLSSEDYLQGLEVNKHPTRFALDVINNKIVSQTLQPIVISGSELQIQGWAVDSEISGLASQVIIIIDGKQFVAEYGKDRADVAKALRNDIYTKSGWRLILPADLIKKGELEINFRVIAADGLSYYDIPTSVKILIE